MSDTVNFDTNEKVNILLKSALGFPSAEESRQWYEETTVAFNNYIIGENIFLDEVPTIQDFNTSGTVRTATDVGLSNSDFESYSEDSNNKSTCSIVDDSTGTIRRYNLLILEQTPELTKPYSSWYKLNSNSENIIKDAMQFNYKQYTQNSVLNQPYLYKLNTQSSLSTPMPFGKFGGNWLVDFKSGIVLFTDVDNFSNWRFVADFFTSSRKINDLLISFHSSSNVNFSVILRFMIYYLSNIIFKFIFGLKSSIFKSTL